MSCFRGKRDLKLILADNLCWQTSTCTTSVAVVASGRDLGNGGVERVGCSRTSDCNADADCCGLSCTFGRPLAL